jgi:hypothetical protein
MKVGILNDILPNLIYKSLVKSLVFNYVIAKNKNDEAVSKLVLTQDSSPLMGEEKGGGE